MLAFDLRKAGDCEIVAVSQSTLEATFPPINVAFPSCFEIALDGSVLLVSLEVEEA